MSEINVALVALYRYQNFPVRIMHAVLEEIHGVQPYSIFVKNCFENMFNMPTATEEALFVEKITELQPNIVGINVLAPYVDIARRLTELVKDHTNAIVVWGGVHPTIAAGDCLKEADIICVGEGEGAIADLAECVRDGQPIDAIENLWVNTADGVVKNKMRPLIQDLDNIPFPAYGRDSFCFIDNNRMRKDDPTLLYGMFFVLGSRGCPYSCSYCANSILQQEYKGLGKYVRRRSAKNVIEEVQQDLRLSKSRKAVIFYDEVFGLDNDWLDEFCTLYKNNVGLPFYTQYNPNMPESKVVSSVKNLAEAGLTMINFGIQSGNDDIRNNIFKRPGKNESIIRLANEIARHKVQINYDLIIDNPYDTIDTLEETIELLLQLPKPLSFHLYSLQFFPDYPLTRQAIIEGHITEQEASVEHLIDRTTTNWAFRPRLFPFNRKQMLQNVVWLVVRNLASDKIVRFSILRCSKVRQLTLICLSLKATTLGSLIGVGGFFDRHKRLNSLVVKLRYYWRKFWLLNCEAFKYLRKGDVRLLITKTISVLVGKNR